MSFEALSMVKGANFTMQVIDALDAIVFDGGFDFVDNRRVALMDDPDMMWDYEHIKADGCCGFHDEEIEIDGVAVLVGFNHGH